MFGFFFCFFFKKPSSFYLVVSSDTEEGLRLDVGVRQDMKLAGAEEDAENGGNAGGRFSVGTPEVRDQKNQFQMSWINIK